MFHFTYAACLYLSNTIYGLERNTSRFYRQLCRVPSNEKHGKFLSVPTLLSGAEKRVKGETAITNAANATEYFEI